ncbi:SpoIIE family protein phosphatase [Streptomyces sp. NBC_01498]|uniref:SpoIIE family protein phosphatase n=1 Tax=Streptomyces sp. NBC_01498 TaxID=2975870 RepID=UPI002E7B76EA|nr:SpoIIE family protein phosphatase [Streptomyces sp. NBC_01498]WTL28938.1 SpoIIE family protein phosphatase [Streptomyces sp. NBC_01498]
MPGNPLAPSAARRFVRAALAEWTSLGLLAACALCQGDENCAPGGHDADGLIDDAVLIVDELVTNAVVHAGTNVELLCRLDVLECEPEGTRPGGMPVTAPVPDPATTPDTPGDPDAPAAPEAAVPPEPAPDLARAALVIEVSDHHPARSVRSDAHEIAGGAPDYGRGLQLIAALSERWGITYRTGLKTVWVHLPIDGPASGDPAGTFAPGATGEPALRRDMRAAEILAPAPRGTTREDPDWISRGALSFLAEASDLLAGQLDEDLVAALAGQLLVPRLADWCAIWLDGEGHGRTGAPRLSRVWHADESRIDLLRTLLEKEPPRLLDAQRAQAGGGQDGTATGGRNVPVPVPWPGSGQTGAHDGAAVACRLVAGDRALGTLVLGRRRLARMPDEVIALIEDFARRVALAIGAARRYTRQATISRVLQRSLLPSQVARIPGVESHLVYEPADDGVVGGDFYDVFPAPPGGRWCFMLGDVQGSGPEAAVVTGLARPWLRLLAREGYAVGEVLDRLNRLLLDDAMEAAEAAALMVAVAGGQDLTGGDPGLPGLSDLGPLSDIGTLEKGRADGGRGGGLADGGQSRFLSLLYGELAPLPGTAGGARCTLASAGHPLPLLLKPDGTVRVAAEPQLLLGVDENVAYESLSFDLASGDTLLCVTDGVTERRSGRLLLDDDDGLAAILAGCAGLNAQGVAERIRRAVHDFDPSPPSDDLALLVLRAV